MLCVATQVLRGMLGIRLWMRQLAINLSCTTIGAAIELLIFGRSTWDVVSLENVRSAGRDVIGNQLEHTC